MSDPTITNCDLGSPLLLSGTFRDELITFAGADTFAAGTILARQAVSTTITVVADEGNTGDGTVTATVTAGTEVPAPGAWTLTCTEAVTNGGVFRLNDPDGSIQSTGLTLTPASAGSTTLEVKGMTLIVTDGDADFAAGDLFTLTVAANGKMVPFSLTGAGGAQFPKAILTYDVTAASAGDVAARVAVTGQFRKERLIIDADGDDTNVSAAVLDQLRSYGLVAQNVSELLDLDNQ